MTVLVHGHYKYIYNAQKKQEQHDRVSNKIDFSLFVLIIVVETSTIQ